MGFEGRVAIITGGTSGIGLAAASTLGADGCRVVITGRSADRGRESEASLRDQGCDAIFVQADVTSASNVERMIDRTLEAYGRLDYAFNNAANAEATPGLIHELSEADFDHISGVCFKGVWLCMKHEIPAMLASGGGAIVNTSSVDALMPGPGTGLYAASKNAMTTLSMGAAKEYAARGIRINVLTPGAFRTPMLEGHASSPEAIPELLDAYAKRIPMGRVGDPSEAAAAVAWLLSDEASYVTGHELVIDGGIAGR